MPNRFAFGDFAEPGYLADDGEDLLLCVAGREDFACGPSN